MPKKLIPLIVLIVFDKSHSLSNVNIRKYNSRSNLNFNSGGGEQQHGDEGEDENMDGEASPVVPELEVMFCTKIHERLCS